MTFLTEEERKERFTENIDGLFEFTYKRDLSEPVEIKVLLPLPYDDNKKRYSGVLMEAISKAITQFIGMWMIFTYPHLNGFQGLNTIEYKII